jgi:hypothetical protein
MPPRHPSSPEVPAGEHHTPDSCPIAAEVQAANGRREVIVWVLGVLFVISTGVGGWAHLRLWSDNDRLTKLETQRDSESRALDQRLTSLENAMDKRFNELRDLIMRGRP